MEQAITINKVLCVQHNGTAETIIYNLQLIGSHHMCEANELSQRPRKAHAGGALDTSQPGGSAITALFLGFRAKLLFVTKIASTLPERGGIGGG